MLATFAPSVALMAKEFAMMAAAGVEAALRTISVPGAMQALREGRGDEPDRLLAEAAPALSDCDAVLLAHFSTSRAFDAVSARVSVPVLTSPRSAVLALFPGDARRYGRPRSPGRGVAIE